MLHRNNYNRAWRAAGAALLALLPAIALAQTAPAPWRSVDAQTGALAEVDALSQLLAAFPDSASVRLRLLNALMNAGAEQEAAQGALELAIRGYAFSEEAEVVLDAALDLDQATWFRRATEVNRTPIERSASLATLPADAHLVESVARDPVSGDLYATTVVSRALFVKRGGAEWQRLEIDGAGSLSGMAYDAKAKLLWIASGNFEQTPGDEVRPALLALDPATGTVVRRLGGDGITTLGDVAVGEDGTVFAADPVAGVVHFARPGEDGLRPLVGPGVFRSPQGMAAVPGGKRLVVSDYRYGLAAVDIASGAITRIGTARAAILDGIDGLWRSGQSLIAVQNGFSPMRIVRLEMADDWRTVRRLSVLEQAHPAWTEPVGGTISNGGLIYVATGQWDVFGGGGAVRDGKAPSATEVRMLSIAE